MIHHSQYWSFGENDTSIYQILSTTKKSSDKISIIALMLFERAVEKAITQSTTTTSNNDDDDDEDDDDDKKRCCTKWIRSVSRRFHFEEDQLLQKRGAVGRRHSFDIYIRYYLSCISRHGGGSQPLKTGFCLSYDSVGSRECCRVQSTLLLRWLPYFRLLPMALQTG